ncbi:MAG: oligoendopeptidase F [Congregibacter sp.]
MLSAIPRYSLSRASGREATAANSRRSLRCLPNISAGLLTVLLSSLLSVSLVAQDAPMRSEISAQYKWDLSDMYVDGAAWEAGVNRYESLVPGVLAFRGELSASGETLLAALKAREAASREVGNLYVYAGLKSYEDQRNADSSGRFSRAQALIADFEEQTAFFAPELLAIEMTTLERMIKSTKGLEVYRHYFDEQSRMRPYTLNESEERLLAMASDPLGKFQRVFSALNNADLTFGQIDDDDGNTVELTTSRYGSFLESPNRRVRKDAWKGLFREYERFGNMLAANYEGHVKAQVFEARARGFDSALQAATYGSAIPESVYSSLITAVRSGAAPLQRYLELRRQALGVERLEIWDMYAPIIDPAYKDIPYESAKQLVAEALEPMGEEYLALYWRGFEEGWVDAFESKGKRSGAYSWGTYDSKPYLSLNYQGTLSDVSTLAHEYGHSLHSFMTRHTQPQVYGYYETFVAEVASMTNEALLIQKLLAEADSAEARVYLLQSYLDRFRGSFFRQASFADFEMRAHAAVERGEALSKDVLNSMYAEVFNAYYGDAVEADPLNASEWSRIPHFMRTDNFYVYQYATSFVAATALAEQIREQGAPARDRFLTMLRSGSSGYAIELLQHAGVDMTKPEPVYQTIEVFSSLVDQLEQALAEL